MIAPPQATLLSAEDRRFLATIVLAGIALRLLWFAATHDGLTTFAAAGEATRVALSLARGDGFAGAFADGGGPTAHVMPVMPLIAGAAHAALGPVRGSFALLLWGVAQAVGGLLLVHRLFRGLGSDPRALRWGAVVVALVPVYAPQETVDFRYWEGGASACLAAANLLAALAVERRGALPTAALLPIAGLWALTALTNPIVGAASAAAWALVVLRRLPLRRALAFAAACAGVGAIVFAPWALRNAEAFGRFLPLRSNFGLEFAIGFPPSRFAATPEQAYADRLAELHPLHSETARAAMIASGGEAAYAERLGAQARLWAQAHPVQFVARAMEHLSQFFAPRPWQMYFTGWDPARGLRAVLIDLINLVGLLGIAAAVAVRRPGFGILAIYVAAVALPYALVQPIPRYSYLVWALLAFAAADLLVRLADQRAGARSAR